SVGWEAGTTNVVLGEAGARRQRASMARRRRCRGAEPLQTLPAGRRPPHSKGRGSPGRANFNRSNTMSIIGSRWIDLVHEIGPGFAARDARAGESDAFVAENYAVLKEKKLLSAQVPPEFGGGGARHSEICAFLRGLARYSPSTALALSMHQHLVAAALF